MSGKSHRESLFDCAKRLLGQDIPVRLSECLKYLEPYYLRGQRVMQSYDFHAALKIQISFSHLRYELYPTSQVASTAEEFLGWVRLMLLRIDGKTFPEIAKFFLIVPFTDTMRDMQAVYEMQKWEEELKDIVAKPNTAVPIKPIIRLQLTDDCAVLQWSTSANSPFKKLTGTKLRDLYTDVIDGSVELEGLGSEIIFRSLESVTWNRLQSEFVYSSPQTARLLLRLVRDPEVAQRHVMGEDDQPLALHDDVYHWTLETMVKDSSMYQIDLRDVSGKPIRHFLMGLAGAKARVLTREGVYGVTSWPFAAHNQKLPLRIPAKALATSLGYKLLKSMELPIPPSILEKIMVLSPQVRGACKIVPNMVGKSDYLVFTCSASFDGKNKAYAWDGKEWKHFVHTHSAAGQIIDVDEANLRDAAEWIQSFSFATDAYQSTLEHQLRITKNFPDQFVEWMRAKPAAVDIELDAELNELIHGVVAGNVSLEIEQSKSGIDWFDINVEVKVSDTTLSQEEIALLLKAKGKWIKLEGKGWRKLEYHLSEEVEKELADIGLSAHEFSGEKHKLHALQLSALAKKNSHLIADTAMAQISCRINEIQTRVIPVMPAAITATLRPYQLEGFHFLAYLSTNQFGGVLADDMGLGKTLQALTWLAWLREQHGNHLPSLVVAPKSVQENWGAEVARFFPALRTVTWKTGQIADEIDVSCFDLLIINYAQLRNRIESLSSLAWNAVIVDEAQNIKNPSSQSAQSCCALQANHRLALTGTPIENRLMDLWSIFSFAMPGVLGSRAAFTKNFDKQDDAYARRRLAARTRPFLLRRTKNEVAKDLPDRIEEDLSIELEGVQHKLYQAELKRARAHLLKAQMPGQLDKLRFHLLTSLLRLRQICCHTELVGLNETTAETTAEEQALPKSPKKKAKPKKAVSGESAGMSAKLDALLELLEPLMEEGQKVLVFSQFVHMLEIIRAAIIERGWSHYILTGQTDNRGDLVQEFQQAEGSAVFLISLKAGGAGLNLTAASYVVLFDPWWNPAVEAQAIDRTHRIGQKSTVFAYRLVVKDSIEQKIRDLQKQKSAIAQDILGEENFARALTLNDFHFLLGSD